MKDIALRANGPGFLFDSGGSSMFFASPLEMYYYLGLLNSRIATHYMRFLSPTINVNAGDLARIPIVPNVGSNQKASVAALSERAIELVKEASSFFEERWEFANPGLSLAHSGGVASSIEHRLGCLRETANELSRIQKTVDVSFIELYGLGNEVEADSAQEDELGHSGLQVDSKGLIHRLLSYAIGCMMGRYSLDKPGLIYARSGNQGFDPNQYKTFRADDDGIIPLLESDWGIRDDAANRFVEFIGVAWPKEHLEENLKFVADSLGPNNGEQPRDTIRRYLATGFYKHHLSMYKKRPIYWLFSSGKQRAFQCLVYLHRYNEGTLARMRTEYAIPLMGKFTARLEQLEGKPKKSGKPGDREGGDIDSATSVPMRRKLEKERDAIKKQIAELQEFDARLRHYADQRIKLDLDDGVKVNYGKFSDPDYGDILADVKAITGGSSDE